MLTFCVAVPVAVEEAPADVLLRWRRQTDHAEHTHQAAQQPQHRSRSAAAANHLPPASNPDIGLAFGGGGHGGTPLLGADLRFSGDGGFSGFSSPVKGRQSSLPLGLHSDSVLQDDVLRMLTFGRLSPLPSGAPEAGSRSAASAGLLSPLWAPAQTTAPLGDAARRSPAKSACGFLQTDLRLQSVVLWVLKLWLGKVPSVYLLICQMWGQYPYTHRNINAR